MTKLTKRHTIKELRALKAVKEVLIAIVKYEPCEVVKDAFAYDRMVEGYREAARKGLDVLSALPDKPKGV